MSEPRMKKSIAVLFVLIISMSMLAGCSGGDDKTPTTGAPTTQAQPTTLSLQAPTTQAPSTTPSSQAPTTSQETTTEPTVKPTVKPTTEPTTEPEPEPEVIPIVPVELTFGDYGLDYNLDYIGDDGTYNTQQMSEERLDAAILLNFYDQLYGDLFDDPKSMTYEEIAPWVGGEASYMIATTSSPASVSYNWIAAGMPDGSKMYLQFREKDGKWLFHVAGYSNLD